LSEVTDPYIDPATGILRNKVGALTQAALNDAESDLMLGRLQLLASHRPRPTGDLVELCAIHRFLFQDVYDWAGQIRTVDLRKNRPDAVPFLPVAYIQRAADFCATELRADKMLMGLGREEFIVKLAHHYDQFNYVHPFREGNGRTQRVFWNRLCWDAGWELDWRHVTKDANDQACVAASENRNFHPLHDMFSMIITPVDPDFRRDPQWARQEIERLGFVPNLTI